MTTIRANVFQSLGGHRGPAQRQVTHRLLKAKGYCPTGSRYITRANVRDIFLGKTTQAIVRNDGSQRFPKQARPIRAHVTGTRLKVGCHVWSGADYRALKEWALNG
jgi:hypothetical protein